MTDPLAGRTVRFGIAAVAAAAAVLSFSSLRDLAVLTSTSAHLAWLLPIAIDAAAAVSTVIWLRSPTSAVVVLARRLAWSTIALSVIGNGVQHAYVAAAIRPPWGVAVAVGAVAPAILGAVIHLVVTARTEHETMAAEASDAAPEVLVEEAPPSEEEREDAAGDASEQVEEPAGDRFLAEPEPPALTGHKMHDARMWFRHEWAQGRTRPPVKVNDWIGSEGYVKTRHVEAWKAELQAEAAEDTGPVHQLRAVGE